MTFNLALHLVFIKECVFQQLNFRKGKVKYKFAFKKKIKENLYLKNN